MMQTSKVLLLLVEGISDKSALEPILSEILGNSSVRCYVLNGDITSHLDTETTNIKEKLVESILAFLDETKLLAGDILKVIQLIDTDGTYIDDRCIDEGFVVKNSYEQNKIITKSKKNCIKRNHKKARIVNMLIGTKSLTCKSKRIGYEIYYFSCNLDHVLHNDANICENEKVIKADEFVDSFYGKERDFIEFINENTLVLSNDYNESWKYIKLKNNSLHKHSNLHILINNFTNE